jgi:ferredoxin
LRGQNIDIPALCALPEYPPFNACMLCLVEDLRTGMLVPACSTPAKEGDRISVRGERVIEARRAALELLISEHDGDCEAPCRRGCPAYMDIPRMIRAIRRGDRNAALLIVRRRIALPTVLGRICPAPCEQLCRRGKTETPVAIRLLERFSAEAGNVSAPESPAAATGKTVAVIGAGPAGLSAARYLLEAGHSCVLFDRNPGPGGMLRRIPAQVLPVRALEHDIESIRALGAEFRSETVDPTDFSEYLEHYDALVVATGAESAGDIVARSFPPGVVLCGDVLRGKQSHLAVRACAEGRSAALKVSRFLAGTRVGEWQTRVKAVPDRGFDSRLHRLNESELETYNEGRYLDVPRFVPPSPSAGLDSDSAVRESSRCLSCDCGDKYRCDLRRYAAEYSARRSVFSGYSKPDYECYRTESGIVYEPGKCIRCGNCVRVAERSAEPLGLGFIGKSYDLRVKVPFEEQLQRALTVCAAACVAVCPTGALLGREQYEQNKTL